MSEAITTKVVRLETQMTTVEQKIDDIKIQIKEVSSKIDNLSFTQSKVKELEKDFIEFIKGWLYPTLSAVLSATVTFLLINYLTRA